MARRVVGTALLLLLAAAMGCDTTQPTAKSAKPAQVYFKSVATTVPLYEVWDASKITVTGQSQTVEDLGLWCAVNPAFAEKSSPNYPLRFSVEIERIPAGSSTPELLTAAQYGASYGSVTPYDDATPDTSNLMWPVEFVKDLTNPADPGTTILLSLKNGRRISTASKDYLEKDKIPSGRYDSVCPSPTEAKQLGTPGVAGSASYFSLDVNAGDTIVVRARKDVNPLTTALFSGGTTFESLFYLEGRDVSNSITGNRFSPSASQDGVSYAFTLR
jgi:hypothetical protein